MILGWARTLEFFYRRRPTSFIIPAGRLPCPLILAFTVGLKIVPFLYKKLLVPFFLDSIMETAGLTIYACHARFYSTQNWVADGCESNVYFVLRFHDFPSLLAMFTRSGFVIMEDYYRGGMNRNMMHTPSLLSFMSVDARWKTCFL